MRTLAAFESIAPVPLAAEPGVAFTYSLLPADNTTEQGYNSSSDRDMDLRALILIVMGIVAGVLLILLGFHLYKHFRASPLTHIRSLKHSRKPTCPTDLQSTPCNAPESPSTASPPASIGSDTTAGAILHNIRTQSSRHTFDPRLHHTQHQLEYEMNGVTDIISLPKATGLQDSITEDTNTSTSSFVSAQQADPEILSPSQDAECMRQTGTDHLEVHVGGTTSATSVASPSQELTEVLSMGLSVNALQTSPAHCQSCEEQRSGSWNISAFDEAAAQIQGSSDNRIMSALNDDFEYCLPANLKLVGDSGDVEGGALNTAFERRVLRKLERFLSKLPAHEKETARQNSSSPTLGADLAAKKSSDSASTSGGGEDSMPLALSRPQTAPTPTSTFPSLSQTPPRLQTAQNCNDNHHGKVQHRSSSSKSAVQGPLLQQPECSSASRIDEQAGSVTDDPLHAIIQPEVPESGFNSTVAAKSAARKLLESSGLAVAQEAVYAAKRGIFSKMHFRRLPPLEEKASQESTSVSASATLTCSTAQSIAGPPEASTYSSAAAPPSGSKQDLYAAQGLSVPKGAPRNTVSSDSGHSGCHSSHSQCDHTQSRGSGCQIFSHPHSTQMQESLSLAPEAVTQRLRVAVSAVEESGDQETGPDESSSGSQPSTPVFVPVSAESDVAKVTSVSTGFRSEPSSEERSPQSGNLSAMQHHQQQQQAQWERAFAARCKAFSGASEATAAPHDGPHSESCSYSKAAAGCNNHETTFEHGQRVQLAATHPTTNPTPQKPKQRQQKRQECRSSSTSASLQYSTNSQTTCHPSDPSSPFPPRSRPSASQPTNMQHPSYVPPNLPFTREDPSSHLMHVATEQAPSPTGSELSATHSRSLEATTSDTSETSTVTLKPPFGATAAVFYSSHISARPVMHSVNQSLFGGVMKPSPSDSETMLDRRKSIDCEPKLSATLVPALQEVALSVNDTRCMSSASSGSRLDAVNVGSLAQEGAINTIEGSGSSSDLLQSSSNLYMTAEGTAGG